MSSLAEKQDVYQLVSNLAKTRMNAQNIHDYTVTSKQMCKMITGATTSGSFPKLYLNSANGIIDNAVQYRLLEEIDPTGNRASSSRRFRLSESVKEFITEYEKNLLTGVESAIGAGKLYIEEQIGATHESGYKNYPIPVKIFGDALGNPENMNGVLLFGDTIKAWRRNDSSKTYYLTEQGLKLNNGKNLESGYLNLATETNGLIVNHINFIEVNGEKNMVINDTHIKGNGNVTIGGNANQSTINTGDSDPSQPPRKSNIILSVVKWVLGSLVGLFFADLYAGWGSTDKVLSLLNRLWQWLVNFL